MRVYVKLPPVKYTLWIEPDTNIDRNGTTPQMLSRLRSPDPVTQIGFLNKGDIAAFAAVKRDQFGNFVGFPSNAIWQVIGDTGIIRISTPVKPYLLTMEGLKYGDTFIRVSDDSGSIADTVKVRVLFFSSLERLSITKALAKAKVIREYYNLRGQKLRSFGNSRVDGIVLERIIGPGGKASMRKNLVPWR